MREESMPAAKIRRFEEVTVDGRWREEFDGQIGIALWCDRPWRSHRTGEWSEWLYCVYFPGLDRYRSFKESGLRPTGVLAIEEDFLGRRHEISFDCVEDGGSSIVEGCYRLPGRHWEVFGFGKEDVPETRHSFSTWPGGMTVLAFGVPEATVLDRDYMLGAMAEVFGDGEWVEVRGPDSMVLR